MLLSKHTAPRSLPVREVGLAIQTIKSMGSSGDALQKRVNRRWQEHVGRRARAIATECRHETTATGVGISMKIFRVLGCAAIAICSAIVVPTTPQQQRPQPYAARPALAPLIGVGLPMIGGLPAAL
jgi:Mn2+/Fe2+ NRAMP family transporter